MQPVTNQLTLATEPLKLLQAIGIPSKSPWLSAIVPAVVPEDKVTESVAVCEKQHKPGPHIPPGGILTLTLTEPEADVNVNLVIDRVVEVFLT
jgi:hypothetical protein